MVQKKEDKSERKRSPLKNWAIFSGIAFQMGATIFLCAWLGKELDQRYSTGRNWFTMGLVLFGLVTSIYIVVKQLKRFNR